MKWDETRLRRSRVEWDELLPKEVAAQQVWWEKRRTALEMRNAGFTYRKVASAFGVSERMARVMVLRAKRPRDQSLSPAESYFSEKIVPQKTVFFSVMRNVCRELSSA